MNERDALQFAIFGRALQAHGVPALQKWLTAYWHFPVHDLPPHPYTIRIDTTDVLPVLDDAVAQVIRIPGFEQTWHHAGGVWQTVAGGATMRLTLMPGHAHITLEHATSSEELRAPDTATLAMMDEKMNAERFAAIYTALTEAVRASGMIPLHCAAIARDDRATLLLGPSGTGKTTTLLRAVQAGWAPVAEDLVWLDPTTLRIYAWDRGVRLWPGTTHDLVPGARDEDWDVAADGKLFMPWERLPVARAPSATLARIVLLLRDDRDGVAAAPTHATAAPLATRAPGLTADRALRPERALTPLAPHDTVRVLWEAAGVPLAAATRARAAAAISGLVPRITPVRLHLNSDDAATALR